MKAKIKKGDTVEVISGRYDDKGRRGEVIKVIPKSGRITVQGVSYAKKASKPGPNPGPQLYTRNY